MSEVASELLSVKSVVTPADDLQATIASVSSLGTVFAHKDFQYSLNMRYDFLIEFLSKPDILMETVSLFQSNVPAEPSDYILSCKIAFCAHLVFASNIPQIVRALLDHREILDAVFSIASKDPTANLTAQGYLLEIFKALINDANAHKLEIFSALAQNDLKMLTPMIHNLSAANASCLKELLVARYDEAVGLQNKVFNYLVDYFLQEKQDNTLDFSIDEFTFENIMMIFQALTSDKKNLEVACYDSQVFVSVFRSENAYKSEYSFHLRVILSKYWATVGQTTDYSNIAEVYPTFAEILNSQSNFPLKKDILELLKTLTKSPNFTSTLDESFLDLVYGCISSAPYNDVIQNYCFQILGQILSSLHNHPSVHLHVGRFIVAAYRQTKVPNVSSKFPNKISLHFIGQILTKLNTSVIENTDIENDIEAARDNLKYLFSPFDTENSAGALSDFSSIVKIIKQDDFAPFAQSFKPGSNPSNNFWKDWSQEMLVTSANDADGFEEDSSPKPSQFSPEHLNIKMIKTHSMNLSKVDGNLISEEAESEYDFNSQKFNVGSIERFDDLSPGKSLENQLFSPRNSGLFTREPDINEDSYMSFAKRGLGTNAEKALMDSYDFLTK